MLWAARPDSLRRPWSPSCWEGGRLTSLSCSFSGGTGPSERGAAREAVQPPTPRSCPVTEMGRQKASPFPPGGATLGCDSCLRALWDQAEAMPAESIHACFAPSPAPPSALTLFLLRASPPSNPSMSPSTQALLPGNPTLMEQNASQMTLTRPTYCEWR